MISIFIIDPAFQNKGYGTHALNKLLDLAKESMELLHVSLQFRIKTNKGFRSGRR